MLHGFWVLFGFLVLLGTEPKEPIPNLVGSMFFEEPIGTSFLRTELLQKSKNRSVRFGRTERLGLCVAREADAGEQRGGHRRARLGIVEEGQGGMVGRGRWRERRKEHLDPEAWLLVSARRENLRQSTVSLSVT